MKRVLSLMFALLLTLSGSVSAFALRTDDPELLNQSYAFSQENPVAARFLNEVKYTDGDYSESRILDYVIKSKDNTKPAGQTVELVSDGELSVVDVSSGSVFKQEISAPGKYTFYNIEPYSQCVFLLVKDGKVMQSGSLYSTGSFRALYIDGLTNVRDLGGWDCDGGTVKYGKLIRGCAFNVNNRHLKASLTESGREMMTDYLGVEFECDLQEESETDGSGVSALGDNVDYGNFPIRYYNNAVNLTAAENIADGGEYLNNLKEALVFVMTNVIKGKTGYIHCTYGRDRAGTLVYILLALLGVSPCDIDKDYEMTSLMGISALLSYRNMDSSISLKRMYSYFDSGFKGETLRDKVAAWAVDELGISLDTINDFRKAMISGDPENIVLGDTPEAGSSYIIGDANGDGAVTVLDATLIQHTLAKLRFDDDGMIKLRGNVRETGALTVLDALCIQRYLAKIYTAYKIGEMIRLK